MNSIYKIFIVCLLFLLSTNKINAQILITEVYPNPGSEESEWIEIYNPLELPIELDGWRLEDTLASSSIISEFNLVILEAKTHLIINLDQTKLNNSGDTVVLYNQDNQVVDEFIYQNSSNQKSFSRTVNELNIYQTTIELTQATPNDYSIYVQETSSPTPTPNPTPSSNVVTGIIISNFLACPTSEENEWVEISNQSDSEVSLSGWSIIDGSSNQVYFKNEDMLEANGVFKISWKRSFLNNSGDIIILSNNNNNIVNQLEYTECSLTQNVSSVTTIQTSDPDPEIKKETIQPNNQDIMIKSIKNKNSLLTTPNIIKVKGDMFPPVNHNEYINIEKKLSKSGIISAIIGGLVLLLAGLVLFYESQSTIS